MTLVEDDIVVMLLRKFVDEIPLIQHVDRNEQMLDLARLVAAYVQLAELRLFKDLAKRLDALFEDFLAMGDK